MGTLNENEEYREQTDMLFMPHSACGFHALSLSTDAKASEASRRRSLPLASRGTSER